MDQDILKKYIAGDATSTEKEQIVAWANADKNNRMELLSLRKLHDILIWQQDIRKQKARLKQSVIYKVASIAAIFILLFCGGLYTLSINKQQIPDAVMQTIRVPAGQRAELILADGTSVWLNAGSIFTFPTLFSADRREVTLDGEGYFSVEKDNHKPFIVKTSAYDVKATGTEFNVHAYDRSSLFEVSLLKGVVDVSSGNRNIRLEPQTKVYLANNDLVKGSIESYDYLLWKDGLICFDDEPVDRMVNKLELYFDTQIRIENASFMKKKYTGKFRTKDGIEHILKVFRLKDKFAYEKDDEKNLITIK
ncbi:MAG: FecR family protein [Tannerella sp.]|jgi:ferric-dicitrate binding protein FerR (iron transport regulator)|nr:FecR family protein [Tannerella sp.]